MYVFTRHVRLTENALLGDAPLSRSQNRSPRVYRRTILGDSPKRGQYCESSRCIISRYFPNGKDVAGGVAAKTAAEAEGKPALPGFLLPWLVAAVSACLTIAAFAHGYFPIAVIASFSPRAFLSHRAVTFRRTRSADDTTIVTIYGTIRVSRGRGGSSPLRTGESPRTIISRDDAMTPRHRAREILFRSGAMDERKITIARPWEPRTHGSSSSSSVVVHHIAVSHRTRTFALVPRGWKSSRSRSDEAVATDFRRSAIRLRYDTEMRTRAIRARILFDSETFGGVVRSKFARFLDMQNRGSPLESRIAA